MVVVIERLRWLGIFVWCSLGLIHEHSRKMQKRSMLETFASRQKNSRFRWSPVSLLETEGFPPPAGLRGELPSFGIQNKMPETPVDTEFISEGSDLRRLDRNIAIVTTAAIPWMTGTAVNPALRAAYLAARGYNRVILMLPWLESREEQSKLFARYFENQQEQAKFVYAWCRANAPIGEYHFDIGWYPARYADGLGSILGIDDIISHIPNEVPKDIVILEEPEHINWYRNGPRWTSVFTHVVGIAHTNYEAYTTTLTENREGRSLSFDALAERLFTETVTRAHCDVVIQLSGTLRPLPHSRVCNVHGVREHFLKIGDQATHRDQKKKLQRRPNIALEDNILDHVQCYFLGKALWAKGYDQLLLLLSINSNLCTSLQLDCYGDGPDLEAISTKAKVLGASGLAFKGRADHGDAKVFGNYDIFVNPSISEVLCTATAEALAMGKVIVIARHPSNEFFYQFDSCHAFIPGNDHDFKKCLEAAARQVLEQENHIVSAQRRELLTWEAATDRLIEASALDVRVPPARLALASLVMHSYHWGMTASPLALDLWLTISGAGPHTPWASRYPAAFRALNTTEHALKHASNQLNKASARLRRGDELALRLARRQATKTKSKLAHTKKKGLFRFLTRDNRDSTFSNISNFFPTQENPLYEVNRFRRRLTALLRGPVTTETSTRKSWLAPRTSRTFDDRPKSRRNSPRLPKDLAARTARAAAQLRSELANLDRRRLNISLSDDNYHDTVTSARRKERRKNKEENEN